MRILRGAVVAMAVLAALPGLAQAQSAPRIEITPIAGGTLFFEDGPSRFALDRASQAPLIVEGGRFADAFTLGVNAGVRLNEKFAVEALFSWVPTELTADNLSGAAEVDAFMYGVTGLFYVPVRTPFGPYWGLGVGAETFDFRSGSIEPETHWQANFVGGMAFEVNDRFGFRIEGRDCFARIDSGISEVSDDWENDLMITAGITWRAALGE